MTSGYEQIEILLVEDNASDAELTLRALKRHNFVNNVCWVKDGREALDFMFCQGEHGGRSAFNSPKLVLLDLKLPKLDGIDVLRELKANERTRLIPVVMLTSSHEERDLVESYRLGVNSYIVKPVEFEEFVKTVSEVGLYWMLANRVPES
ncbi:MAG: response regulator [Leptospirales bacterium]